MPAIPVRELASTEKRIYVLDTNVLMHDPAAMFHFAEHDVFIPMTVLGELDHCKKGPTEAARNARQASRFLYDLITKTGPATIREGIPLCSYEQAQGIDERCMGRLFFETEQLAAVSVSLSENIPDNTILKTTLALSQEKEKAGIRVVLVTKDINVYIKAAIVGIDAQDYENDKVLDDVNLLYKGMSELPPDFWHTHTILASGFDKNIQHESYKIEGPLVKEWYPNEFLYLPGEQGLEAMVRSISGNSAELIVMRKYYEGQGVWGINARNKEQNAALNMLMNPDIDLAMLLGVAGTGKTLMTLAAAATQTCETKLYKEAIVTRDLIPMGEGIGFLPGKEEDKLGPWMGAVADNLELLSGTHDAGNKPEFREQREVYDRRKGDDGGHSGKERFDNKPPAGMALLLNRIKIKALTFFRGRTFMNRFLVIDECQNLTSKQMKSIITRAGPGTKVVLLGNLAQIDTPYLSATTSGLTYVVDRFKDWPHSACITLKQGERSRLASHANDVL